MYGTKSFTIISILLAFLIFSGINFACGAKSTETPPSPGISVAGPIPNTTPQIQEETPPSSPPTKPEPEIPANFTTYTDESKLFSISYPADWQEALSQLSELEQKGKEAINKLNAGLSVDQFNVLFFGGKQISNGYMPNVNVGIAPMPKDTSSLEQVVEVETLGIKRTFPDYKEFSIISLSINGRQAIIVDWEGTPKGYSDKARFLQMYTLVGKTVWLVTCTSDPEDFDEWAEDFNNIVRSLRISE